MDTTAPRKNTDIDVMAVYFLENLKVHNYSSKSIAGYEFALKQFTGFVRGRGKRAVLQVTPQDIADYRLNLVERRLKQNSLYVYLRVIRLFFKYLHEHDHVFVNPAAGMRMIGPDRSLPAVPSEAEIEALLSAPDTSNPTGIRDRALLETMYSTATRREETTSINVSDVDLSACTIRVMGKGKQERVVPLGKQAGAWLQRYLVEARDLLKNGNPEEPALWLGNSGTRLNGQVLNILIRHYAKSCASIKTHITTHSLRRACATHMLQHGANPLEIQLLLGHADLTHLRNYLRLSIRDLKVAHEKTRLGE